MKALTLMIALCAIIAAGGCGSDDASDATGSGSTTTESSESGTTAGKGSADAGEGADSAKPTKPNVQPPSGPPPAEDVIEDVDEGSGPAAEKGDKVTVHFVADNEAGKEAFSTWPGDNPGKPLVFRLGSIKYSQAFEEGVEGMRAGGRRELSVPAARAGYTKDSALFYVIDLLKIE